MTEKNKITKAITLLLEQTQEGVLKWRASAPGKDLTQGDNIIDVIYVAEKEQRTLRLYTLRFRSFTDVEEWHWEDEVALELSDPLNKSWWRFPKHPVILDLLEAVQFKTVGVDTFIDKLIAEKDNPLKGLI